MARNAVVVQLQKLVGEGLVRRGGHQRTGVAGKPGYVYELVPGNEDVFSEAYRPLVGQILAVLRERLRPKEIADILEAAGERLAHEAGLTSNEAPRERLAKAVAVVNGLGACAEIVEGAAGKLTVENRRCPFAHAVRRDACVCHAAAAFFRAATGLPFEQKCDRGEVLTCRYVASVV
jgi:predicted ArsR family transcriptional regulator